MVALRKDLSVERGDQVLFNEYRYFFYVTNDWAMTDHQVVAHARARCDQENLIAQLKGQVRALHAPVNTLVANWAYMAMAAIAWSIKAWCALLLPVSPRWAAKHEDQRRQLLVMDFRTFLAAFIEIPCQVVIGPARCAGGYWPGAPGSGPSSGSSTPSEQTATVLAGPWRTGVATERPDILLWAKLAGRVLLTAQGRPKKPASTTFRAPFSRYWPSRCCLPASITR